MKTKNNYSVHLLLLLLLFLMNVSSCKNSSNVKDNKDKIPIIVEHQGSINDFDGNSYKTIRIGTQIWFAENLKTTTLNDGRNINLIIDGNEWSTLSLPSYCWYNNNESNKNTYGALYNWYAVNTSKLCPTGWHVPSKKEWSILINYLGGEDYAGGKLKEAGGSHWESPNEGATNESAFNALPGGYREANGSFDLLNSNGNWWTSSSNSTYDALSIFLFSAFEYTYENDIERGFGFSIRCIKD
jgi:uncharacterized protein (TIGR02145 family)